MRLGLIRPLLCFWRCSVTGLPFRSHAIAGRRASLVRSTYRCRQPARRQRRASVMRIVQPAAAAASGLAARRAAVAGRAWVEPLRIIVVGSGFFMVLVDTTVLNVALPGIGRALDGSIEGRQWVVDAYALVFAGLLLTGGRPGRSAGGAT